MVIRRRRRKWVERLVIPRKLSEAGGGRSLRNQTVLKSP